MNKPVNTNGNHKIVHERSKICSNVPICFQFAFNGVMFHAFQKQCGQLLKFCMLLFCIYIQYHHSYYVF